MRNYRHRIMNRIRRLEASTCITPELAQKLHHLRGRVGLEYPIPPASPAPFYLEHSSWLGRVVEINVPKPQITHKESEE